MYSLIREFGIEVAPCREAGPFLAAFILASISYKFGSFALECGAFLFSWRIICPAQAGPGSPASLPCQQNHRDRFADRSDEA